jgi:uncharacterized protein YbbK (DUF523 family)
MAIRRNKKTKRDTQAYAYLVSACLAGIRCTYKGGHKLERKILRLVEESKALPVCPELLGGSGIPRPNCEIKDGDGEDVLDGRAKVITRSGRDISKILIKGAKRTLGIAKKYGIKKAVLKSKSPSCGCARIYDGTFSRRLKKGDGVTAALLRRNRISVFTEKDKNYAK